MKDPSPAVCYNTQSRQDVKIDMEGIRHKKNVGN